MIFGLVRLEQMHVGWCPGFAKVLSSMVHSIALHSVMFQHSKLRVVQESRNLSKQVAYVIRRHL